MLTALADELRPLAAELEPLGHALSDGDEEAAAQYLGLLERLANVGELLELPALGELTLHMLANVPAQLGDNGQRDLAANWPNRLAAALSDPQELGRQEDLLQCLTDPRWPEPMDLERAQQLLQQILQCDQSITVDPRQPQVFDETELGLEIQGDLTPEMRAAFSHEAPRQSVMFNQHLAQLHRGGDTVELLNTARRVAHTLKGSAALVGARAVVNLTHLLEEVLGLLQEHPEFLGEDLAADLQEAGDTLEEMIECLLGQAERPVGIGSIIQRIDIWAVQLDALKHGHDIDLNALQSLVAQAEHLDQQRLESGDRDVRSVLHEPATDFITEVDEFSAAEATHSGEVSVSASSDIDTKAIEAELVENEPANLHPEVLETTLNVPVRVVDDMLRNIGELMIQVGHLQTQLRNNIERSSGLGQQLLTMQEAIHELESHVDLHGTPALQAVANRNHELFDPLELDQYNHLHSLSRSFAETALDAREMARELHDAMLAMQNQLLQQQRTSREVNNSVLAARMVKISSMASRWQRIVRQACRVTGKRVNLEVTGGEVYIDTDILNGLVEPLLHMLRNAVDHGIESADQRRIASKPEFGSIKLSFRQDGNRIEVNLKDDGRGLDFDAIEHRARNLGLIRTGQQVTRAELQQWVLLPGFTTRDEVSEVSGRGIGLDAVRAAVQQLGGTINLHSETGRGLTVRLVLPQSLSSTHLLFVRVGGYQYGLPSLGIQQILFSDAGFVDRIGERWVFRFGNRERPLYRLADLIGMPGDTYLEQLDPPRPLILVDRGDEQIALLVDGVVESRESVVKSLKPHFPHIHGASGASVLADGGLAIVLDLAELQSERDQRLPQLTRQVVSNVDRRLNLPRILVVDDSLSARRSLVRFMQDLGYQVDSALDGIEALERMEENLPDLVLADLEMPRMNGLEFTAHIRTQDTYRHIPVVMITSRSTEKHRQQAEKAGVNTYLTKPYQEQDLADLVHNYLSTPKRGVA